MNSFMFTNCSIVNFLKNKLNGYGIINKQNAFLAALALAPLAKSHELPEDVQNLAIDTIVKEYRG